MKEFEMHGRMEEPARERRRREKRDMDGKKEEEEKPKEKKGYLELFNGKEVEIELVTKESIKGVLESNPYNKFDLLLHMSKCSLLVPKHSVVFITPVEANNDHSR